MAEILLGAPVAEKILEGVKSFAQTHTLKLAAVGSENLQWQQYVRALTKSATLCNVEVVNIVASAENFCELLLQVSGDSQYQGVLVQQPLPKEFGQIEICWQKDVDCVTGQSVAKLYRGEPCLLPATPLAVLNLLDYYGIDLCGKNVVIVGRGNAVGKPLALMCLKRNATVTVCHTKTINLAQICRGADVIISACGVAGLITSQFVTEHSIVVDVGLSFVDGKSCGDVSPEVRQIASAVSPVPGGVGPVTRATLFANLVEAAKNVM